MSEQQKGFGGTWGDIPKAVRLLRRPRPTILTAEEQAKAFLQYIDVVAPPPKPRRPQVEAYGGQLKRPVWCLDVLAQVRC